MSATIEINGTTLVPIKDAAALVSYSRDYVSRLAREGKIVASQIGRQWFVDMESLRNFSSDAELQEETRKQELRQERKRELHAKEEFIILEKKVQEKIKSHRINAVAVTMSALCLGLTVGVCVYTLWLFQAPFSLPSNSFALVTSNLVGESASVSTPTLPMASTPHQTMQLTTVMEQPIFVDEAETRALSAGSEGILVFNKTGKVKSEKDVAELFSDDVVVEFSADNSGVIFYNQGEDGIKEYPFVSVPTREETVKKVAP